MRLANRQPSVTAALALVAALGAVLTLGSCNKNPTTPEDPDPPGIPKDPDGTAFRQVAEGFYFV
jgi:hypothetical protein